MADVQSVPRSQTATVQTAKSSYTYRFRGIDQMYNAVGPALRRHGVFTLPAKVEATYSRGSTSGGGGMRECTVTVTWDIWGPAGDRMTAQSVGEGMDTSDKATNKAVTAAHKNLFVPALAIPTEDPKSDPDNTSIQRGEQPMPKATDFCDEIGDPRTSMGRLKQIRSELHRHNLANRVVTNEVGDEETLLDMVNRVGLARQNAGER